MDILQRRLTPRIEHSLKTDRVTALMGPRQAGKTTLVRHLLQYDREIKYYNLKDPLVRQALKENSRREFAYFKDALIILDEVQTMPSLLELIQLQVDESPERKGCFLLLGSNHLLLNRHIKESLAGRVALFTLLPFSFAEMIGRTETTFLERLLAAPDREACASLLESLYVPLEQNSLYTDNFEDLNRFGGYPEFLHRKDPEDRIAWLGSYHQTYLETDLRQLVELRNSESFEIFEKMFALRAGNLMNISELGRDCGLAADTVRRFIGYYKQLFIAWQARPYHINPGKRMMKMSKYFFYDTGVLRSILGNFSGNSGQLFENTVLAEAKKILSFHGMEEKLYFARTATGVEADGLLWSFNGKITFFLEVKQTENIHPKDLRHLKKYVHESENSLGLLLYNGSQCKRLERYIWAIPAPWLFA